MSARLLKDPATASSRIFVGHLQTDDVNKMELEEHFAKYGTVIASIINRGFGFVQFEDDQSAQKAIQNEDGAMFKGRRIDVRPAKKDQSNSGNAKQMSGSNNQFNPISNQFNNTNESFAPNKPNYTPGNTSFNMNPNFGNDSSFGNNQKELNIQNRNSGNSHFDDGNPAGSSDNDQFNGKHNNNNAGNDHFNNPQNRGNNQFNPNRGNDQFAGHNQRGNNNQFGNNNQMGNQNRPGGNQNRNQTNPGNNQNQNSGGSTGVHRPRGTRGGKNRNKNNQNNPNANNFRDRSPINRGNRIEDKTGNNWDHKQGDRLRSSNFNRDSFSTDSGNRYDDFKASGPRDTNNSFGNSSGSSDFSGVIAEKNDCEIIVVNKVLTKYAEDIELRLKQVGLMVDLLFPNEDVPLARVLGNIASRGCLYAVVVKPTNQEHHSLTLNILHGVAQEHRNMPFEDAINLISRDFANYKAGGRSVPLNTALASERHPDAIQVLLNMLADNRQLTVLQYERVIKYLGMKREEQVQVELGDVKDLPVSTSLTSVNDPKQAELQTRILNILNNSKTSTPTTTVEPSPVPPPSSAPTPVPPATWGTASNTATTSSTTTTSTGISPSPLLKDPTVQKALDNLLQGNILKNIGDQQPSPTTPTGAPLFAAFSNINRF